MRSAALSPPAASGTRLALCGFPALARSAAETRRVHSCSRDRALRQRFFCSSRLALSILIRRALTCLPLLFRVSRYESSIGNKVVFMHRPMTLAEVPPAVLPDTPERFPIPPGDLIAKAQQLLRDGSGVKQPELLADNFRFEFPIVSLSKKVLPGPLLSCCGQSFTEPRLLRTCVMAIKWNV